MIINFILASVPGVILLFKKASAPQGKYKKAFLGLTLIVASFGGSMVIISGDNFDMVRGGHIVQFIGFMLGVPILFMKPVEATEKVDLNTPNPLPRT